MKDARPFYFEEIEYDSLHHAVHGYTVIISETMRLTRLELFELNPTLSDEIDAAALSQAAAEEYERATDHRQ